MIQSRSNDYECPACGEWVSVALPVPKYVDCPGCLARLEVHPDAEFEDGSWHDLTHLSVADSEREHIERMLDHAKKHELET